MAIALPKKKNSGNRGIVGLDLDGEFIAAVQTSSDGIGRAVSEELAPGLLIAFLAGSIVGVAIMLRDGSGARKRGVPFAPFMALGGLVSLLAGSDLIDLYTRTFLGG